MTAFVICVGSSLLSKTVDVTQRKVSTYLSTSNKDQKHTPKVNKRDSSQVTSPTQTNPKKANMDTEQPEPIQSNGTTYQTNSLVPVSSRVLKDLLGPIIHEVRELKESVHSDYNKLHDNYSKLEGSYSKLEDIITSQQQVISKLQTTISTKQKKVADDLSKKIEENSANIKAYISENKRLLERILSSKKD